MGAVDFGAAARAAIGSRDGFSGEAGTDFYTSHGARDEAFLSHVHGRGSYYHSLVPDLPTTYRRMMDGDAIEIGFADDGQALGKRGRTCASSRSLI